MQDEEKQGLPARQRHSETQRFGLFHARITKRRLCAPHLEDLVPVGVAAVREMVERQEGRSSRTVPYCSPARRPPHSEALMGDESPDTRWLRTHGEVTGFGSATNWTTETPPLPQHLVPATHRQAPHALPDTHASSSSTCSVAASAPLHTVTQFVGGVVSGTQHYRPPLPL